MSETSQPETVDTRICPCGCGKPAAECTCGENCGCDCNKPCTCGCDCTTGTCTCGTECECGCNKADPEAEAKAKQGGCCCGK